LVLAWSKLAFNTGVTANLSDVVALKEKDKKIRLPEIFWEQAVLQGQIFHGGGI